MYDVIALGELLIDFAAKETDADGYPTMKANPGGAPGEFSGSLEPVMAPEQHFLARWGTMHSESCCLRLCRKQELRPGGLWWTTLCLPHWRL